MTRCPGPRGIARYTETSPWRRQGFFLLRKLVVRDGQLSDFGCRSTRIQVSHLVRLKLSKKWLHQVSFNLRSNFVPGIRPLVYYYMNCASFTHCGYIFRIFCVGFYINMVNLPVTEYLLKLRLLRLSIAFNI